MVDEEAIFIRGLWGCAVFFDVDQEMTDACGCAFPEEDDVSCLEQPINPIAKSSRFKFSMSNFMCVQFCSPIHSKPQLLSGLVLALLEDADGKPI